MTSETTGNLNNDWVFNKIKELCLLEKTLTIFTAVQYSIVYQSIDPILQLMVSCFELFPNSNNATVKFFYGPPVHTYTSFLTVSSYEKNQWVMRQIKLYQTLLNSSSTKWSCTNLHHHQKCIKVSIALHPWQYLGLSGFLIFPNLLSEKCFFIVLLCISLIVSMKFLIRRNLYIIKYTEIKSTIVSVLQMIAAM